MPDQRSGARTAIIAIGVVAAICNAAALCMYAFMARDWYRQPYFIQRAMALSPAIGSTHRGEWGVHWGYGEWAMLAGGLLHLSGLVLYGRSSGREKRLLYMTYAIIFADSVWFILYFLVLQPRSIYFVMPGTQPGDIWWPLIAEAVVRVWWVLVAAAAITILAAGDAKAPSAAAAK